MLAQESVMLKPDSSNNLHCSKKPQKQDTKTTDRFSVKHRICIKLHSPNKAVSMPPNTPKGFISRFLRRHHALFSPGRLQILDERLHALQVSGKSLLARFG